MAHAYTTKRGKTKIAKLGIRKDQQQNLGKHLKLDPLENMKYDGPNESKFELLQKITAGRLEDVKARLSKALMDKCSNPSCTSASADCTLSECGSCRQARYCGRECQLAHWQEHKTRCKEVREDMKAKEEEKKQDPM